MKLYNTQINNKKSFLSYVSVFFLYCILNHTALKIDPNNKKLLQKLSNYTQMNGLNTSLNLKNPVNLA